MRSRSEVLELARCLASGTGLQDLVSEASSIRDAAWGNVLTWSPKVFIPLTKACRDVCHYCTFATPPAPGERAYMSMDDVLEVARAGEEAGCAEALFTLGDKPERRYKRVRDELHSLGFSSTVEYLYEAAKTVMDETGLLPHLNPGVIQEAEIARLRGVSASMGLMVESMSERLAGPSMPHWGSPDKDPASRLECLAHAGALAVPFTTGLLIGIGETWEERAETILAIADLNERHGHIQEVIVQNFRAKPGTLMHDAPEPNLADMQGTIALARLALPPSVSIQAPPNLAGSDEELSAYIASGINDWGGVSTVTPDFVNPEAPWPAIRRLEDLCESNGFLLAPRLTIYPRFMEQPGWVDKAVRPYVLKLSDTAGLRRDSRWHPGEAIEPPAPILRGGRPRLAFIDVLAAAREKEVNEDEITLLLTARGEEAKMLFDAADSLRREVNGDTVTFVVNRNINYTNMCYFKCGFCAFSKGPKSLNLRGDPYLLSFEEITSRTVQAWSRGATEVCLQGGIHPSFTGDYYSRVVGTIKAAVPQIHIHAFSPLEIWQGAHTLGVSVKDFLRRLRDEGLSTLPGTAAEILDDEVRAVICPDKINTAQWSEVAMTAHELGLRMTTTMMFGHADSYRSWARHLIVLRSIQKRTGGFTEFVPLPFVHMAAPIFLRGKARPGPTFEESLKVHAVARLALHPWITNIQTSWVKMGIEGAKQALQAGVNDLGGTLMNETISRAAGAAHGQEVTRDQMHEIAASIGRPAAQRTTLYGTVREESHFPATVSL